MVVQVGRHCRSDGWKIAVEEERERAALRFRTRARGTCGPSSGRGALKTALKVAPEQASNVSAKRHCVSIAQPKADADAYLYKTPRIVLRRRRRRSVVARAAVVKFDAQEVANPNLARVVNDELCEVTHEPREGEEEWTTISLDFGVG